MINCLQQQLKVSVDPSDNPFGVINGAAKDGCMFWYFEMHMQDGSNLSFQTAPYSTFTLNGKEYLCKNKDLKLQIYEIGESYLELIYAANKTAA